jgi:ElaB/YqjD/DUF883 family membrane-anchored ribosome-binding protein
MVTDSISGTSFHATQEFTRKVSELRMLVEDLAKSAPEAAREQLSGLKDGIASLLDQGRESTTSMANRVVATVKTHPGQVAAAAAAAAVGVGLITWWLISRRE